jgi:bifunctional DNA-binding transcriptional regulator/antitoxin component of YhaV-PrlF toxin-antitoxin module
VAWLFWDASTLVNLGRYNKVMAKTKPKSVALTRLGAKGQLTLPTQYRRALSLSEDAAIVLVRVGDTLVIAPQDEAWDAVTRRLEAQMQRAGSSVEELIAAAGEARAEIAREQFDVSADACL